jgi:hypothetical protein
VHLQSSLSNHFNQYEAPNLRQAPPRTHPEWEFEIWITVKRGETYRHFVYFPGDLAHEDAAIDRIPGPVPVCLDRLRQNLLDDGIDQDLTEFFFTTNPDDDTLLLSEIGLENHIELAYWRREPHIHWILHCQKELVEGDRGCDFPAVPSFTNVQDSGECRWSEKDILLSIRIPCCKRRVNYFVRNLYQSVDNRVISYSRLLTNLQHDLQTYNLDLSVMELVDLSRNIRVRNQRALSNYYQVAIAHGARNVEWT